MSNLSCCFLGGNTCEGFVSLYDELTAPGDFLYVIKGSPGCGKSSFMRRIALHARQRGLHTLEVLCSGDPDSLDALVIPERHLAYVDGTAPHVRECPCPGGDSAYLDLGQFLDLRPLRALRNELCEVQHEIQTQYALAYTALQAAGALCVHTRSARLGLPEAYADELWEAAKGVLSQAGLQNTGDRLSRAPRPKKAFLSAISCQGILTLWEGLRPCVDQIFWIESDVHLGLGAYLLQNLAALAQARGDTPLVCPDPLTPALPEAVILPKARFAFVARKPDDSCATPVQKTQKIILNNINNNMTRVQAHIASLAPGLESGYTAALQAGLYHLSEAHKAHDQLEGLYHEHVDFASLYALSEAHIAQL